MVEKSKVIALPQHKSQVIYLKPKVKKSRKNGANQPDSERIRNLAESGGSKIGIRRSYSSFVFGGGGRFGGPSNCWILSWSSGEIGPGDKLNPLLDSTLTSVFGVRPYSSAIWARVLKILIL